MRVNDFPTLHSEVDVFGVTNPKSRHNEALFRNLKAYKFTSIQKDFYARQATGQLLEGEIDITFGDSARALSIRYGLSNGTTSGWIQKFNSTTAVNNSRPGRPDAIDEIGLVNFHKVVAEGTVVPGKNKKKQKKSLLTTSEVNGALDDAYNETRKRAGHDSDDDNMLSINTLKKYKKVCSVIYLFSLLYFTHQTFFVR